MADDNFKKGGLRNRGRARARARWSVGTPSPDTDLAEGGVIGGGIGGGGVPEPQPSSSSLAVAETLSAEPGVVDSDNWAPPTVSRGPALIEGPPLLPWNYKQKMPFLPLGHGSSGRHWVRPLTKTFFTNPRVYPTGDEPIIRHPIDRTVETYYASLRATFAHRYGPSDIEGLKEPKPKPKQD